MILMSISITRFEAEKAMNKLNKMGFKIGIIHLINLKPFKLKRDWIKAIKSTKFGILMTDNDYVDGILRTLAHKINANTGKSVHVMGLEDKSAGHTEINDNLPPNSFQIIQQVKKIIKKRKK